MIPAFTAYFGPWSYDRISYEGKSYTTAHTAIRWKPDGSGFVALSGSSFNIFDVSPIWDVSTASANGSISITPDTSGSIGGFTFSDDGNKMFIAVAGAVEEHALSTPYGGTGTYTSKNSGHGIAGNLTGLDITLDGDVLLVFRANDFAQTTLSTAFTLSSAGAWSAQTVAFSADAAEWAGAVTDEIFTAKTGGDRFDRLNLATPKDVTSLTTTTSSVYIVSNDGFTMDSFTIGEAGRKLYVSDGTTIRQYNFAG